MARIDYPVTFEGQQTLFTAIMAQHKTLGTKSPLLLLAKKQKMDLAKLEGALQPAAEQNQASGSLRRDSEEDTQQRDNTLEQPLKNLHGEVDFLKGLLTGAERELGEWGITVDGKNRVAYPTGVVAEATLIQAFLTHHLLLKEESPLLIYLDEHPDINVDDDLAAAAKVIEINTERNATTGNSQLATQQRNQIWEPVAKAIHVIGNFLMGLYHENSRKMALWGYKVVEDAAGEKVQHSKVDPIETKVQKSVVIPSVFTNEGEDVLHVWKGTKQEGEPMVVKPGGVLGMTKGYSTITVYNPSTLVIAEYSVTVHI